MQLELNSLGSVSQPGSPSQFPEMAIVKTLVGIHPDFFLCFYMKSTCSSEKILPFRGSVFFFYINGTFWVYEVLKFASSLSSLRSNNVDKLRSGMPLLSSG